MSDQNPSLPRLDELFQDPHPVIKAFLAKCTSPYDCWYPVDASGEVSISKTKQLFLRFQKRLGSDDLKGAMPLMRYQPRKGSNRNMLRREYKPDVHRRMDIKSEEDFRARRASLGPTHHAVRGLGCIMLFGGFRSRLDGLAVIKGPLFAGDRWDVRATAKVIGPSLFGNDTLFNTGSEFVRSVIGNHSQIDSVVAKDALIGSHVYVMPGAKLLHRNGLGGGEILVMDYRGGNALGELIHVPRRKMGCVIGDGCVIGANAVVGVGSILMPNCRIPNGLHLPSGIYDQGAIDAIAQGQSDHFVLHNV